MAKIKKLSKKTRLAIIVSLVSMMMLCLVTPSAATTVRIGEGGPSMVYQGDPLDFWVQIDIYSCEQVPIEYICVDISGEGSAYVKFTPSGEIIDQTEGEPFSIREAHFPAMGYGYTYCEENWGYGYMGYGYNPYGYLCPCGEERGYEYLPREDALALKDMGYHLGPGWGYGYGYEYCPYGYGYDGYGYDGYGYDHCRGCYPGVVSLKYKIQLNTANMPDGRYYANATTGTPESNKRYGALALGVPREILENLGLISCGFTSETPYQFYVVTIEDTTPPYTSGHDPAPSATDVPIDTNIVVHVQDDGAGVDQTTIVMSVEGAPVIPVISGSAADYTLTYNPSVDFAYSQVVDVTIDASDLAGTPNAMTQDVYSFTTGAAPDTTPPYTSGHDPAPSATDVPIDTNIVVHVQDDGAGVDQTTIVMSVEGAPVIPVISGSAADYTLTYNPSVDFAYSQVVDVTIDASDLAGTPNAMTQDVYSFTTGAAPDTTPPYTSGHDPAPSATDVPIDTNIVVHVQDDGAGVDQTTIVMSVEGAPVIPVISGSAADYTLTYNPSVDFAYSQVVDVTIDASDLAGTPNAMTQDVYSFTTIAAVATATGSGTATFTVDNGNITGLTAIAENTLPTAGKPSGVTFPHGFFSFNITGIAPGSTVTVTITLPLDVPIGTQYWKYQAGSGWFSIPIGSDDGDNVITIQLTDGGLGDADGAVNGTIVDPGGTGTGGGSSGGGGGGGGGTILPTVTGLVVLPPLELDTDGIIQATCHLKTTDGKLALDITKGTKLLDSAGKPLRILSAVRKLTPPSAPSGAVIIIAYDLGLNGATFSPPVTLTLSYDPATLPEDVAEEDLYIAYWDGSKWVALETKVDTMTRAASGKLSHFTTFALIGSVTPPAPAAFSASNLSINPLEVEPNDVVNITLSVANTGDTEGSYSVVLKINGAKEAEKSITLAPGKSQSISFSVIKAEAGSYSVTVEGLSGSFTVAAPVPPAEAPPEKPINWPLLGGIIAGVVVVGLIIFFVVRRRAY